MTIQTYFLLSILLALSNPPPSRPTFKQFVGNGQKLVQTRDSWKIKKKGNNVLAGKRKRVLVQKTRLLATFVVNPQCCNNIISVSDSSVHIVAEFPHCSIKNEVLFTDSLLNSIRSELLAFSPFCEMKALEVNEHRGSFMTSQK